MIFFNCAGTKLLRLETPIGPNCSFRGILTFMSFVARRAGIVHTGDLYWFRWATPAVSVSIVIARVVTRYRPVSCLLSRHAGISWSSPCTFFACLIAWLGWLQTAAAFLITKRCLAKLRVSMDCIALLCLALLDTLPTLLPTASIFAGCIRWTTPALLLSIFRSSAELLIVNTLLVCSGHRGRVSTVPTLTHLGAASIIAVLAAVTIHS